MANSYNPDINIADLDGKVAVVTGAYSGIGYSIVKQLLDHKLSVVYLLDIAEGGEDVVRELKNSYKSAHIEAAKCDVSSHQQFRGVLEKVKVRHGGIDILCNNAGVFVMDDDLEKSSRLIRVNMDGTYFGTMLGMAVMNKRSGGRGGVIINTASQLGLQVLPGNSLIYTAAKHGVVGLTRASGIQELYEMSGVRVNAVCPGAVNTPLLRSAPVFDKVLEMVGGEVGMLQPAEVADVVLKIISHDTLTGASVLVLKSGIRQYEFPPVDA